MTTDLQEFDAKLESGPVGDFLSAEDLGIGPRTYRALLTVLRMLENEELKYVSDYEWNFGGAASAAADMMYFNMNMWYSQRHACGTVGCIGGWAQHFGATDINRYSMTKELVALCWPPHGMIFNYSTITTKQAARALRNYLEKGKPYWEEVLLPHG